MRQKVADRDDEWLERQLSGAAAATRAPRGFTDRVMNAVYREALAPRAVRVAASAEASEEARRIPAMRLYRRVAVSLMLTGVVLAVSLLVPRASYPTLIGPGEGAALGRGPSDAVKSVLVGAATAVQGALGERSIEGGQP